MSDLDFTFVPAVKGAEPARVAIIGPPGAGKTWTALELARGFGGLVGVIDTDRRKARAYAADFDFHHLPMARFDPAFVPRLVAAAEEQHVEVLILDTASPFWSGADGMLEQVDRVSAAAGRPNDKFNTGWNTMRPVERAMFDALFGFSGHLIVTIRTKVEYVVEVGADGRSRPRKVGTRPDQRDGVEYDFDVVLDMAEATGQVTKTRCPALVGQVIHKPGAGLATIILDWLSAGAQGGRFHARDVLNWAMADGRTRVEVGARYTEMDQQGYLNAMVTAPNGERMTLGAALSLRGQALRRAEETAAARAGANGAPR